MTRFPALVEMPVRYGDLGPDGTVRTTALARWFEDTRISGIVSPYNRLVHDGGYGSLRILLATLDVERLAPVSTDAAVRIGIGVRRVGRTSFVYGYGVLDGDRLVGRGETVTVLADADGPAPLPDELREQLAASMIDEPTPDGVARPGAERRERAAYPFAVSLPARVEDLDTNRHVNNVTLLTWYVEAVSGLATDLLGGAWGGPPPELAPFAYRAHYVAEVGYPGRYEVAVGVAGHDDDTVHYALGLFHDGGCVGLADATGRRGALPAAGLDGLRLRR